MDVNEELKFCEYSKKNLGGGGGGSWGGQVGGQGGCELGIEVFVNTCIQKKNFFLGGVGLGRGGSGWGVGLRGVRVHVNDELKFL